MKKIKMTISKEKSPTLANQQAGSSVFLRLKKEERKERKKEKEKMSAGIAKIKKLKKKNGK